MNTLATAGRSERHATIAERIADARRRLIDAGFEPADAALDADVLARDVLGWDRARLLRDGREPAMSDFDERFRSAIGRRLQHEPVAMITGHREFWSLDFHVTRDTLVPRPETEIIVDEALQILPRDGPATIVDIGTGTGCLAIALAHERPSARIIATDSSHAALLVARSNARRHRVAERVNFVRTDLAAGLCVVADLIVSNPPYVPDGAAVSMPPDVARYEPAAALFGGPDGLAIIRRLIAGAHRNLAPGGRVIVEFGVDQERAVREIAERDGWTVERVVNDLQGIARTIVLGR